MKLIDCLPTKSPLEKGGRGIEIDNQVFIMKNYDLKGGAFSDFS